MTPKRRAELWLLEANIPFIAAAFIEHLETENAELCAKLAEAEKDTVRLDWLMSTGMALDGIASCNRAAIDAAMEGSK